MAAGYGTTSGKSMMLNSQNRLRPQKTLIMMLILILILPSWLVAATGQAEFSDDEIITDADLNALVGLNVFPVLDSSSGWVLENSDDVGSIDWAMKDGMVFTCEPGIYILEEGLGVRLENDILITQNDPEDLMKNIPIEIEEIEMLMNE